MYVSPNFKSKKALKDAVAAGQRVTIFQHGLGDVPTDEARVAVEGPHYPQPHTWYAEVTVENGRVTKVK